jgi:hypothetical protein
MLQPSKIYWKNAHNNTFTYCFRWPDSDIFEAFAFVKKKNDGRWEFRVRIHKGNSFGYTSLFKQGVSPTFEEAKTEAEGWVDFAKPNE